MDQTRFLPISLGAHQPFSPPLSLFDLTKHQIYLWKPNDDDCQCVRPYGSRFRLTRLKLIKVQLAAASSTLRTQAEASYSNSVVNCQNYLS
ncbi:unnamed protein product [Auanema sp. JU1783]|nr:unnamed protein product [Auanema sp. JU1783]